MHDIFGKGSSFILEISIDQFVTHYTDNIFSCDSYCLIMFLHTAYLCINIFLPSFKSLICLLPKYCAGTRVSNMHWDSGIIYTL